MENIKIFPPKISTTQKKPIYYMDKFHSEIFDYLSVFVVDDCDCVDAWRRGGGGALVPELL